MLSGCLSHGVAARLQPSGCKAITVLLIAALWITAVLNLAFWRRVWGGVDGLNNGDYVFLLSLPLFVLAWNFVLLWAVCWGRMLRPILAVMILLSAAGSYFLWTYGVLFDASMLMNVIQTDIGEASELLTPNFWLWMIAVGVVPVFILYSAQMIREPWKQSLIGRGGSLAVALVLMAAILATQYQSHASLVRNNREIRLMLLPSSVLGAVHSFAKQAFASPKTFELVGQDAELQPAEEQAPKKKLLVLVVGETARAMNFSLNGYGRSTNPQSASRAVISYTNVSSCGTATAISVPCLFQEVGRDKWKNEYASRREGLLDVLQRSGVSVLWRDNNSGCKSACDRVTTEDLSHAGDEKLCRDGECFDEILLSGLQENIEKMSGSDSVIVLHMKGSHGPAYYKRYPKAFERFTPTCKTSQLDQCSDESILNAYDNTLLYSDYVLGKVIDLLKANSGRVDSAMLYVSDHGESLGEKGVYLHGLPYAMAPKEQTQIPMLLWMAPALAERRQVSSACLADRSSKPVSHDNVYHSVRGLMGVNTSIYQKERDIFSPCKIESSAG